jgi:hypothetical protein
MPIPVANKNRGRSSKKWSPGVAKGSTKSPVQSSPGSAKQKTPSTKTPSKKTPLKKASSNKAKFPV